MEVDGGRCRVEMGLELWDGLPGAGVVAFSSSADAGAYSLVLREFGSLLPK